MWNLQKIKRFSFLHYEKLKYQVEQRNSVRIIIGMAERLLFTETDDGIEVELIEIDSTQEISRYKHDTNWYKTSAYRSPKIFV